jgi:hypothetical protein
MLGLRGCRETSEPLHRFGWVVLDLSPNPLDGFGMGLLVPIEFFGA